jgi:hypothetical protein
MNKFLKNEKGSVLVMSSAIIVCIVSAFSAVSLLGMVRNGQLLTQYEHDAIQQELLLRSESVRGHLALEHNSALWPPPRNIQINQEGRRTYYEIKSKTENTYVSLLAGQPIDLAVAVKSLITCKRGTYNHWNYISPVTRLSERLVKSQSLAQYQYFTDTDKSENEDGGFQASLVKFWGPDVLWGPVHSNSDIYIQQGGGGNNDGWPTFHAKVTTAGRVRLSSGGLAFGPAPELQICRGGLEESIDGVTEIIFEPDANKIAQNGAQIGLGADIVFVRMDGSAAEVKVGHINYLGTQSFDVYSWYPKDAGEVNDVIDIGGNWFEDSDLVWTNDVAVYDTVWTDVNPLSWGTEGTFWVPDAELWIQGKVSGKVTFGCADTIYITDDIYYNLTDMGVAPDDEEDMNPADFFGLVSNKSILIRYKHKDPFEPNYPIAAPNCDDIFLYGAYAALGRGDEGLGAMACHEDGIFGFQYQHPHGSTPNFRAPSPYWPHNDTLYTYIDLHKYIFPPNGYLPDDLQGFNMHGGDPVVNTTCGFPYTFIPYYNSYPNNTPNNYTYPYGTDYPWYNPIWPEPATTIIFERGIIHMWGAVAQRRRGFVHRSGTDPYNHPGDNAWDMELYHYDGFHGSTGYDKDYHYDNRLLYVQPPNYPEVYEGWGESSIATFNKQAWVYKSPAEW